jgi:hypothetical protein
VRGCGSCHFDRAMILNHRVPLLLICVRTRTDLVRDALTIQDLCRRRSLRTYVHDERVRRSLVPTLEFTPHFFGGEFINDLATTRGVPSTTRPAADIGSVCPPDPFYGRPDPSCRCTGRPVWIAGTATARRTFIAIVSSDSLTEMRKEGVQCICLCGFISTGAAGLHSDYDGLVWRLFIYCAQ